MTTAERVAYACVHTDYDDLVWAETTLVEIAREGKLEHEEARNLLLSLETDND